VPTIPLSPLLQMLLQHIVSMVHGRPGSKQPLVDGMQVPIKQFLLQQSGLPVHV
jgi:hypothetical protein